MATKAVPRVYQSILAEHLGEHRQMAFVAGARQVGKTTVCRALASRDEGAGDRYLDWDNEDHRRLFLAGPKAVAAAAGLDRLTRGKPVLVFDELHKHRGWKGFLKGFFDVYGEQARVIVTGSGRLDVYRRGGDSLMGRYLLYRMHPISIGELARTAAPKQEVELPRAIPRADLEALWAHGGYPEPFTRRDARFSRRWQGGRVAQLVREDIRDLARVQDLARLEGLVAILAERSAQQLVLSPLASDLQVSVDTIRRWVEWLAYFRHGFTVKPWSKNVAKALRKEPKWYLSDWSGVTDLGARTETLVACHLLKAVEGWTDLGFGRFELRYLRDKEKREVDFLVVRDGKPWFLAEVKHSDTSLSRSLAHFQAQTKAPHAFQIVWQMPFVDADPFLRTDPCVVPASTFLSQLL